MRQIVFLQKDGVTLFALMPALTDESDGQDDIYWSLKLLNVLQDMAEKNTNAVLMVLAGVEHLEVERRYPENGLWLAHGHWRAYYHCHESSLMHPNEHGHFHLFTDIGKQTWAHVAGLSIDAQGQPLQWFTVNRWVTDGPWLERKSFPEQLKYISADDAEDNPVGRWLEILLRLYHAELLELLADRDQQIARYTKAGNTFAEVLEDSDIYRLSTGLIDLQSLLENRLLCLSDDACQASTDQ